MGTCDWCGLRLPGPAASCPRCGKYSGLSLTCDRCGHRVPPGADSCRYCGYVFDPGLEQASGNASLFLGGTGPTGARSHGPAESYHADAPGAWPASASSGGRRRLIRGSLRLSRLLDMHVDPFYLAALVLALSSGVLFWLPAVSVPVAGAALVASGLGYRRRLRLGNKYAGLWVNVLASLVGLYALASGMQWSLSIW